MTTISTLPILLTPPSSADKANFRVRADAFLASLPAFCNAANMFASSANSVALDINTKYSTVINYHSNAYSYMTRAESAANRAEAVVIPTEATYSLEDLEVALNGLLTQVVAQQAQISVLIS